MRILVTGKSGQLGRELQRTLATLGEVLATDRSGVDLENPESIRSAIRDVNPDVIVNAAAYTAVDKAESEPEPAMRVNAVAPGVMAEEAKRLNALLVHYSTDYVFDGTKQEPYNEDDAPNPVNVYGWSKLVGEQAIQAVGGRFLIFRTSWVYGAHGTNFLRTILRLSRERSELRVVDDQLGAPTWSRLVAEATSHVLASMLLVRNTRLMEEAAGVYHLTCGGETSWFGFALAILKNAGRMREVPMPRLEPIPSEQYPQAARRPKNSRLDNEKLYRVFRLKMPAWEQGLAMCLEDMNSANFDN